MPVLQWPGIFFVQPFGIFFCSLQKTTRTMKNLKITVFADPVCTWCWGSVPVLRALEYSLADKVEIEYVMGCMIDDIRKYNNRRLGIGGDIALSNRNIMNVWNEASAVHGMPVCERGFHLFSEEYTSTVPQNLAYIAATIYHHKVGGKELCPKRFLRRLQEATAIDAALTCDATVVADIAAAVGYEPARFKEIMQGREAQHVLEEERALCRRYDVNTFPTYLLEYRETEIMLRGFTSFETLVQNISEMSYGKMKLPDDGRLLPAKENVRSFVERYGSVYPVEIATAFSLARKSGKSALNVESYEHLPDIIEELVAEGHIAMRLRGNGFIIYAKKHIEAHNFPVDELVEGALL